MLNAKIKSNINLKTYETFWIQGVAIAIWFIGIVNILSAWFSFDRIRLNIIRKVFESQIIVGSRFLIVLTGIVAMLIAPALYRRKKIAWFVAVFILAVSGIAHIIKGADIEEAGVCMLLLGILLPLYKYCNVKSDPLRLYYGGRLFLGAVGFVLMYTFIGIRIFENDLGVNIHSFPAWRVALHALSFDVGYLHPHAVQAKFFVDSLLFINSFSIILGLILALSPVIARSFPETNLSKYRRYAEKHATQPVQFFTLTNQYQHFLYSGGFIGFKIANRVAMAIGNPCIDKENCTNEEIIEKWLNYVFEHDWIPAFYQAQGEFADALKEIGFNVIPIGVEAPVELASFSLDGKAMQHLRTVRNKSEKDGWVIRQYTKADWRKVRNLNRIWLRTHHQKENSFAMGKSTPEYLEQTRTILAFDKNNRLMGYINSIDLPEINSRSVDIMRRDPKSPPGVMDMLFLSEILSAKEEGKVYYDLGFSPLAKIDETFSENKLVIRLLKLVYEKQSKYYDFQGLHKFKSKFQPDWQPSYLAYPSQIELPQVLMSLIKLNRD